VDNNGRPIFTASIIPNRGAWLEFETDASHAIYVKVDRTRKIPATVLLRAMGLETDAQILETYREAEPIRATLDRDNTSSQIEALIEVYKRLRPGEPPTEENARTLFQTLFNDPKRYDLAGVGRYKVNKKLRLLPRILGRILVEPVADPESGEIIAEPGAKLDRKLVERIEAAGVQSVVIEGRDRTPVLVVSNGAPDAQVKTLTRDDIVAVVNYVVCLMEGIGSID